MPRPEISNGSPADAPDEPPAGADQPRTGMGPVTRGPAFLPSPLDRVDPRTEPTVPTTWGPVVPPNPHRGPSAHGAPMPRRPVSRRPASDAYRPATSRVPALVTAVVIALVVAVVATASVVAYRHDTWVPGSAPPPASAATPRADAIAFDSPSGAGELIILQHRWTSTGGQPPASGTYLRVEVKVVCTEGQVDYAPYSFQTFDADGRLYEVIEAGATGRLLDIGTLRAGESVTGYVAFDMPRGDVTLLMTDDVTESVTALRIAD